MADIVIIGGPTLCRRKSIKNQTVPELTENLNITNPTYLSTLLFFNLLNVLIGHILQPGQP